MPTFPGVLHLQVKCCSFVNTGLLHVTHLQLISCSLPQYIRQPATLALCQIVNRTLFSHMLSVLCLFFAFIPYFNSSSIGTATTSWHNHHCEALIVYRLLFWIAFFLLSNICCTLKAQRQLRRHSSYLSWSSTSVELLVLSSSLKLYSQTAVLLLQLISFRVLLTNIRCSILFIGFLML